ncbi:hypothetical protein RHGRI_006782 [Rhododendron griersonianum]|uniref:Uncharacterized protein n=1 Tax=Rhododendron griersonianum TaxID=479676 RepID=A0AAV6KVT0_9ERIC|nr:hypothetical protein RHGRI_006782 [Rhododendron griersonianum]
MSKGKKSVQPSQGTKKKRAPTNTEGPSQKRQKGVRLPKIGFSAEEWLSPLGQDFVFEPIREPTEAEMSRRNIPRPSIPTKSANPARGRGADQQQQQQKKQKLLEEVPPPSASKTAPSETRRPPPQKDQDRQAEGPVDLDSGPVEAEVPRPFSPTYTTADGRVLMLKDSVKEEPNLAVTLLRGLALPRDYDQLPTELIPGLGDMCSHLVQAGQAALKAYDRAIKVTAERERYRTDRDNFRAKFKISETQADAKGYEAGIKRAALEYTQTAHQMVNDELETRLPIFYELGYAAGADAMAGVLVVESDSDFRRQLPPPVIPDLELPYTEEECAPLPPEEDEDEDEVMKEAEDSVLEKPSEGGDKQEQAAVAEGEDGAATTLNLLT